MGWAAFSVQDSLLFNASQVEFRFVAECFPEVDMLLEVAAPLQRLLLLCAHSSLLRWHKNTTHCMGKDVNIIRYKNNHTELSYSSLLHKFISLEPFYNYIYCKNFNDLLLPVLLSLSIRI